MRLAVSPVIAVMMMGLLAAACSKPTELASSTAGAAEPGLPPPAEASGETPDGATPDATPNCAVDTFPATGLCADDGDALFQQVNNRHPLQGPHCVWRPVELTISDTQALLFRAQDCSEGSSAAAQIRYTFSNNQMTAIFPAYEPGEPPIAALALEVFMLADGESAEQAALKTLTDAPADQRARCETRAYALTPSLGPAFVLWPNAELKAELDAANQGDVYDACGPYGLTDSALWWEARPKRALFHSTGQDDPAWDPVSFTFYAKGDDESWAKE